MDENEFNIDSSKLEALNPPILFRFHSKKEDTDSFFNGNIMLSKISKHKQSEDIRSDGSEGSSEYKVEIENQQTIWINEDGSHHSTFGRGVMNCGGSSVNQFYVLCLSAAKSKSDQEYLRKKFSENGSPSYIRITDIDLFTQKVKSGLISGGFNNCIMYGQWFQVDYSKGELRKENPEPFDPIHVYQKPHKDYFDEQEWRLVFCMKSKGDMNSSDHLVLRDDEEKIYEEIAGKHELPKDYFRDNPDEKERFLLDLWDVEWKNDFFIKVENMYECCEIVI